MAEEPSGRDLRRLRTLENRLEKETENRKTIQAERNQLRRELRSANTQIQKLEAQVTEKVEAFKACEAELDQLREARTELEQNLAACQKEMEQQVAQLETQLREERQEAATSIDEARQRITTCETDLAEAREIIDQLQGGETTIPQLLEENQRLAALAEASRDDLDRFRTAAEEAGSALEAVQAELATVADARTQLESELQQVSSERSGLETQVSLLTEQLQTEGKTPLLPADKVADLIGGLVSDLQAGLPDMSVRDSEIRLKVGFGAVGEKTGFVVPTPESDQDVRENLHEVVLRFNRTPTLSTGQLLQQADQS